MLMDILPRALRYLILSLLWSNEPSSQLSNPSGLRLELRHELGLSNSSRVVFSDISTLDGFAPPEHTLSSRPVRAYRPVSQSAFSSARRRGLASIPWDDVEVEGPDVQDRETLLALAKMTSNAYSESGRKDWYDLGPEWNNSYPFGWEPDADGFRGHIFATSDNSTVIISVKGTSAGWVVGGGGPTTRKDKLNDNLLFSCCCARVGPTWTPVCDCHKGGYKCDQGCLEKSLADDSLFYSVGINLYNNVTYMYPNANIWLTGHSLGGSLASLIGVTFGAPVVAFEAPGDKLAASRLHLPGPPSIQHITHVYHTADPIPMGVCTGVTSSCAIGGYALETGCHLGKVIKYDTVSKLGWRVDIRTHGIAVIVDQLLATDWDGGEGDDDKKGKKLDGRRRAVPDLIEENDCVDCFSWEFGDFRNASAFMCPSSP